MAMRNINAEINPIRFHIGNIPVFGDLVLAPMAGYSDSPNRLLARRFGSALSYTEFVNAIDIVQDINRVSQRLAFQPEERPVVFQIFDNDPTRIVRAAEIILPLQPDILDINLGCSARSVSNRGAGAGLLRRPELIDVIFKALVRISPIPVTAKIRLGWDEVSLNYLEISKILEGAGASMIAVHGRTKRQAYSGASNWQAIAEIKQAMRIPVIGNGDVRTLADIEKMKAVTGCDGVMIGRGSFGNPWIFSRREHESISFEETRKVMLDHLELMTSFYGIDRGPILFRKHLKAYLSPYKLPKGTITHLVTTPTYKSLKDMLVVLVSLNT
ncbi:MAG: tRNA dihydrouridine synthase DusB [Anaerolinea sp.]|nr:tRNA dihydrouridine synthase DusB [Anaerolinea sp.]